MDQNSEYIQSVHDSKEFIKQIPSVQREFIGRVQYLNGKGVSACHVMQISNAINTRKKSQFRIRITSNVFRIQMASEYQAGTQIYQQIT